jgi:hypothetical protein
MEVPALAAGGFIAFTVVRIASESKGFRISMFAMAVILIGTIFSRPPSEGKRRESGGCARNDSDGTASPIIRKVAFVSRPNVYFIGFDRPLPMSFSKNSSP